MCGCDIAGKTWEVFMGSVSRMHFSTPQVMQNLQRSGSGSVYISQQCRMRCAKAANFCLGARLSVFFHGHFPDQAELRLRHSPMERPNSAKYTSCQVERKKSPFAKALEFFAWLAWFARYLDSSSLRPTACTLAPLHWLGGQGFWLSQICALSCRFGKSLL